MGPVDPDAVFAMFALLMTGGAALIGLRMFLNYRIKRFQAQASGERPPALDEGLAELKEQMYLLRGDVADLQERMDFTERVLTRGQGGEKPLAQP
jgi:short-subunit dehydrogenase involved in D-alanine esterification of teichoic acids